MKYTFVLPKCIFSAIFSNENSFNLNNPYNNLQLTPKITSDKQSDKGAALFTLQ
ncbi:hypothetical protein [uncultured Gammaproteobacteria bacterium]|nr:hypothetical protein [uncultured Gammaproteobacteria bacterium]